MNYEPLGTLVQFPTMGAHAIMEADKEAGGGRLELYGFGMMVFALRYANIPAELEAELTDLEHFPTRQAARTAVFDFIEVFYNRQRLYSSLDYRSPAAFETAHLS